LGTCGLVGKTKKGRQHGSTTAGSLARITNLQGKEEVIEERATLVLNNQKWSDQNYCLILPH